MPLLHLLDKILPGSKNTALKLAGCAPLRERVGRQLLGLLQPPDYGGETSEYEEVVFTESVLNFRGG